MQKYEIRAFTRDDIPRIMALQISYRTGYPKAEVVAGGMYLSPAFDDGRNVFCAFDTEGKMVGYSVACPHLADTPGTPPGTPHRVWAIVKIDPELSSLKSLPDELFDRVNRKAIEITQAHPGYKAQLMFQHDVSETDAIDFLVKKGCTHTETALRMSRDLTRQVIDLPVPTGIEVKRWHIETVEEQQAYLEARNEALPELPLSLAEWRDFSARFFADTGAVFAAFDSGYLVGSVCVCWVEAENRMRGIAGSWLDNVFVRSGWRQRGLASCLISQAHHSLKEHGLVEVRVDMRASNHPAFGLYGKMGYRVTEEKRQYALPI